MRNFNAATAEEWTFILIIFLLIVAMIAAAEWIRRWFNGATEITRKSVHIGAGALMIASPYVLHSGIPALAIALVVVLGTFLTNRRHLLQSLHATERNSYGTTFHPLSFFILILLFWTSQIEILVMSILVLAVPDAIASVAGQAVKDPYRIPLGRESKTLEGAIAMFVSTAVCLTVAFQILDIRTELHAAIVIGAVSFFATGWELISIRGSDNLTVPLGTALMLHLFLSPGTIHPHEQVVAGVVFGAGIGLLSYYLHFLSISGSIATFLLATIVYGIGGWVWTVPILTFFIASSLLSKYGKAKKKKLEIIFDKTDKRDSGQVAANGGVAGLIVIASSMFPERSELYLLYIAAVAAVTADTWGTEIGTLFKGRPRSIVTLHPVDVGTSGGVSLVGFLGGATGALLVVLSAWVMDPVHVTFTTGGVLVLAGVIGSAADSLLGATVQAQYRAPDGRITERTMIDGVPTELVRGFRWMDNDLVNLLCAVIGAGIVFILL